MTGFTEHKCKSQQFDRDKWGCDHPVESGFLQWGLICRDCLFNTGFDQDGQICLSCSGKGLKESKRCPNSIVSNVGVENFEAYKFFLEHNVLPCEGGIYEQTLKFLNVYKFCQNIKARCEQQKEEEENQKAKSKERLKQLLNKG